MFFSYLKGELGLVGWIPVQVVVLDHQETVLVDEEGRRRHLEDVRGLLGVANVLKRLEIFLETFLIDAVFAPLNMR